MSVSPLCFPLFPLASACFSFIQSPPHIASSCARQPARFHRCNHLCARACISGSLDDFQIPPSPTRLRRIYPLPHLSVPAHLFPRRLCFHTRQAFSHRLHLRSTTSLCHIVPTCHARACISGPPADFQIPFPPTRPHCIYPLSVFQTVPLRFSLPRLSKSPCPSVHSASRSFH